MAQKLIKKTIGFYINILCKIAPKYGAKFSFNLFCTPIGSKIKPFQEKFLNTSEKFTFPFDGKNLQAYKWGNGKIKIVLLHGWGVNSFRWKSTLQYLRKMDASFFAFDAPAHGASGHSTTNIIEYSKAIKLFVDRIGGADISIAHSIGGAALINAAHTHPQNNFGKLSIIGAPGAISDFFDFYQRSTGLWNSTIALVKNYFAAKLGFHPETFTTYNVSKNIPNTTLIIHDTLDNECPYKYAVLLQENMPNSSLVTTTGIGHSMKSPIVYEVLEKFIDE
jgi:pimeloyl-ACP methyl ester carboxylesterase